MKFVCYSDWIHLPESADALFKQEEKGSIFFSRSWFECLTASTLEVDHTMVFACVVYNASWKQRTLPVELYKIQKTRKQVSKSCCIIKTNAEIRIRN